MFRKITKAVKETFVRVSVENLKFLLAYFLLLLVFGVNIWAMKKGVQLKDLPVLEALGYVFVPLLSSFILEERIEYSTIWSVFLIVTGIVVFYL